MRVVVDSAIPYIRGLLEPFAEVDYREGRAIDTEVCRKADALLVRTRTQCNAALLEGSTVRFIGTATIGTDHIDSTYCAEHGITVVNAPGCNAWAVVQWVVSILAQINQHASFALTERPVGIVGCGAIGERLARLLEIFHIPVFRCDPFLETAAPFRYTSLERIGLECSIITIHTPLTHDGAHPTYHLLDAAFFHSLKQKPYILHAARGGIVDDYELYEAAQYRRITGYYLDVYEDEPDVAPALLEAAKLATPHIAGYSIEGKLAASRAIVKAVGEFFGWQIAEPQLEEKEDKTFIVGHSIGDLARTYDIVHDSRTLKSAPQQLEQLRTQYAFRHDFRNYHFGNQALERLVQDDC